MSEEVNVKKNDSLSESDILASLETAISSYEKKDFHQIAKESLSKTKGAKRTKIKKVMQTPAQAIKETIVSEEQYFKEDPLEAALQVVEESKAKKTKSKNKKVKKSKVVRKNSGRGSGRRMLLSKLNIISPIKRGISGYASNYKRHVLTGALSLMMVGFVGFSSYMAYAYVSGNNGDVVQKVGSHVVLPTDETPKVYIVQSEKSEIFQNPLFKGIKVGDNVLSYSASGKVIIYRSSEDKVVNIVNTTQ